MRAHVLRRYGRGRDIIDWVDIEPEPLGSDDVRIAVAAAGINPVDVKTCEGEPKMILPRKPPFVLGVELAGRVMETGRDVTALRAGDEVEVIMPAASQAQIRGQIAHISEQIDHERRAATVRVEVPNADRTLRPGQSVTARIHATGPREERLLVPKTAVTRIDGEPTVFVSVAQGKVEPRNVQLGPEDADDVAILSGLAAGDRVVTRGVLALKAEVFR